MQPRYDITVANSQTALAVDDEQLRQVAERTLALEEVCQAEISIAVIDNDEIHDLNRRFLEHDYATDVLSFLLDCEGGEPSAANTPAPLGRGKTISGEVIVSAEMAADRAEEFGWPAEHELLLYLVHGLLHLCGYDDHTDAERAMMRQREQDVLKIWQIIPRNAEADARSEI